MDPLVEEAYFCSTLLLCTCLVAFTICFSDLYLLISVPQLRTTFGRLCLSQRIADLLLVLCFMLYVSPMIGVHPETDSSGYTSFVTFVLFPLHFCAKLTDNPKSLNRFVAVWFPMSYDSPRHRTINKINIVLLWTLPTVYAIIPLANRDCQLYFYSTCYCILNDFSKSCGQAWETYALGYVQMGSCFLSIGLDIATFTQLWKFAKRRKEIKNESGLKSYKREIYFLIQTIAADLIVLINLIIVFKFGVAENQSRFYYFFIQTELWVIVDTEKLIMSFICNLRIKRLYSENSHVSQAPTQSIKSARLSRVA